MGDDRFVSTIKFVVPIAHLFTCTRREMRGPREMIFTHTGQEKWNKYHTRGEAAIIPFTTKLVGY